MGDETAGFVAALFEGDAAEAEGGSFAGVEDLDGAEEGGEVGGMAPSTSRVTRGCGTRLTNPGPSQSISIRFSGVRIHFERSQRVFSLPERSGKKPGAPEPFPTRRIVSRALGLESRAPGILSGAPGKSLSGPDSFPRPRVRYFRIGLRSKRFGKEFSCPGRQWEHRDSSEPIFRQPLLPRAGIARGPGRSGPTS